MTSLHLTFWSYPTALLVVGGERERCIIFHVIPEDGTVERYIRYYYRSLTHGFGATDLSRELLGSATVYDDDENMEDFSERLATRLPELLEQSGIMENRMWFTASRVSRLVDEVLRPAGLEALGEREERTAHSISALTGRFSVYIVLVKRSRRGRINTGTRLTSFPDRLW